MVGRDRQTSLIVRLFPVGRASGGRRPSLRVVVTLQACEETVCGGRCAARPSAVGSSTIYPAPTSPTWLCAGRGWWIDYVNVTHTGGKQWVPCSITGSDTRR
jgi:hypothetical protein